MNITHLDTIEDRINQNIKVSESKLLPGEKGLFAFNKKGGIIFRPNDKITEYLGEKISTEERKKRYGDKWGPYVYFKPYGHPSIDAQYYRNASAYANDGAWIIKNNSIEKRVPSLANAKLERGFLVATKNIKNNEEIFLDYSENYWKKRYEFKDNDYLKATIVNPVIKGIEDILNILTPVEKHNQIWIKRDDLFNFSGAIGGKARSCLSLFLENNITGIITAGSRMSPQVEIVGKLCNYFKVPGIFHLPEGKLPDNIINAIGNNKIIQHFPGFNNIINYHAHQDAIETGYLEIPFGMKSIKAIEQTRKQCENIPPECKRIIVVVGSGMTLPDFSTINP